MYDGQLACASTDKGDTTWFGLGQGVRQGYILSPTLLNLYAECIIRRALDNWNGGLSNGGWCLSNLRYADDTALLASSKDELSAALHQVKEEIEALGLFTNVANNKLMVIGNDQPDDPLIVDGVAVEKVTEFNFLGAHLTRKIIFLE